MSGRSYVSGSVRSCGGSVRLGAASGHEVVLDALYERKRDKKSVRVLTVLVYVFCVSLAAIMLSLYYVFFWEPKDAQYAQRKVARTVDRQTSTTPLPTCFMPHTGRSNSTVNEIVEIVAPPTATPSGSGNISTEASVSGTSNATHFTYTAASDTTPRDTLNATSDDIGVYNATNIT